VPNRVVDDEGDIALALRDNAGDGLSQADSQLLDEAVRPAPPHAPGVRLYCCRGVWLGPGHKPEGYRSPYGRGHPLRYYPFVPRGPLPIDLPGEYRIRNEQGKVVRAGISFTSLKRRMLDYIRAQLLLPDYCFDYMIATESARQADILYHEYLTLQKYQPELNTYHTRRRRSPRS